MKVLLVSRWFWEEQRRLGGGFLREQVEAMAAAGVDLTILSQSMDAGLKPERRELGGLKVWVTSREKRKGSCSLPDKLVKFWGGYRKAVTDATVIRQMLGEHGPFDVVWAQVEEPDGLCCVIAKLGGKFPPLVTQVFALRYALDESGVHFRHRSSLGWVFRSSDRVGANSEATASWMRVHYGAPPARIFNYRHHLTKNFLDSAQDAKPIAPEKRILFLGALNRKKGPDVFLRAAKRMAGKLPGWSFVMVGGETERDDRLQQELETLKTAPELQGRVESLGKIPADGVRREILRASVVVCPSRIEEFSRTAAEALVLGRPVILTETTGAAGLVCESGAGRVVPPGDDMALAAAIEEQITTELAVSRAVSQKIASELTAERAAEELIEVFKKAVG
ncbi:MAG: glycosyltransferase family 4 protein [Methylacidiphilales bacterium]|nr:glycosyltransferase family 4 protein [Candidatus Methylacidiphilales bacterium]